MTAAPAAMAADLTGQLAVLAAELESLGFAAKVLADRRGPCLKVTNPAVTQLSEAVYAARSRDGEACFWWSWGERIVAIANTQAAVSAIARVLA